MTLRAGLMLIMAATLATLLWLDRSGNTAASVATGRPATGQPVAGLNPLAALTPTSFANLDQRPLFAPSRRKAEVKATDAQVVAPAPEVVPSTPAAPVERHPVLMGTVTSPRPGGAYLGDNAGGPVVFLQLGQSSQGYSLESVQNDRATFQTQNGEVTLILQIATR